nr:hypothetical protein GCM10020093_108310 [Planobispora longispora]
MSDDRRERGLEMMRQVYGWEIGDAPGDFFGVTVDHLFAEIWTRPGLSMRDRRLLLVGALAGQGLNDVLDIQIPAALANAELSPTSSARSPSSSPTTSAGRSAPG